MIKHQNKLPLVWFGLQKRETERYLSHLEWLDNSKAEQLEDLILTEKWINRHLRQELELKKTQQHDSSDGFADLLRSRLDHSVEAMRRQGEAERESLYVQMETKRNEQDRKLQKIDMELAEYRNAFNGLLAEASRLITTLHHQTSEPDQTEFTTLPREQTKWKEQPAASSQQELAEAQAAPSMPEMSAMSLALEEEIKSLQNRYIVGKEAGGNLYDEGGNLIIGKGETITAHAIQAAVREGKLPDLIVQMVTPGFAEPS